MYRIPYKLEYGAKTSSLGSVYYIRLINALNIISAECASACYWTENQVHLLPVLSSRCIWQLVVVRAVPEREYTLNIPLERQDFKAEPEI
jgi:hypothetical protein